MKYLCLIYDEESHWQSFSDEERQRVMAAYGAVAREAREAKVFVGGNALKPARMATTVRLRDGRALHTDGPFAETKEQLGGYFMLECDTQEEAARWAAKIPSAAFGTIEVRAIAEH